MRYLYALIGTFSYLNSFACECSEQPFILDLYSANVVFIGTTIDKTYSVDSSEYTITFATSKFFKNTKDDQETLKFTKTSEGRYSNIWFDCPFHLNVGYEWLIIANYKGDEIVFDYCSESRIIDRRPLSNQTKELLNSLSEFDISQYRFSSGGSFSATTPLMNLDSLANSVGTNKFEKQTQLVVFDFDREGNLTSANFYPRRQIKMTEPIFGLSWFENIEYVEPKNDFEKLAIDLARKITKWTPIKHKKTGEAVLGRATAFFIVNELGEIKIEY